MPRATRVPLAQRLDELAERLGLRDRERRLCEEIAKGLTQRQAGVQAGYSASSPATLDAAVSRALARPRVAAYLAELKQIGLAATGPTMARLMGAESPGPSAVIAARAAAIQAVRRHGWAKVQKKVTKDPLGNVTEVVHTRTVDAANAARVLMEDHRSTENAKLQAQATMTAAAARSIGDMARAKGVDLGALWSAAVLAADDPDLARDGTPSGTSELTETAEIVDVEAVALDTTMGTEEDTFDPEAAAPTSEVTGD